MRFLLIVFLFYSCEINKNRNINDKDKQEKITNANSIKADDFIDFLKNFGEVIKVSNYKEFEIMSFDSIKYLHEYIPLKSFINNYYNRVFSKNLIDKVISNTDIEFTDEKLPTENFPNFITKRINSKEIFKKRVNIKISGEIPKSTIIIVLEFIETDKGYKFSSYDKFGY